MLTVQRPGGLKWKLSTIIPLSLTTVELQVSSHTPSLNFLLGSSASLHCSFSMAPGLVLTRVEWRLQYKGNGQLVYSWTTGQGQAKREGATLEPEGRAQPCGHFTLAGETECRLLTPQTVNE